MKEKLVDRVILIITVLVIILALFIGYKVINRVNPKRQIKNDIKEIFKDYEINRGYSVKIRIHSKKSNSTKISYNVEIKNNKYDDLDIETQKEIIKYIKGIAFKGNGNKYSINKVTIITKENTYTYQNLFRKNDEIISSKDEVIDSAKETIKEKWNEFKDKVSD